MRRLAEDASAICAGVGTSYRSSTNASVFTASDDEAVGGGDESKEVGGVGVRATRAGPSEAPTGDKGEEIRCGTWVEGGGVIEDEAGGGEKYLVWVARLEAGESWREEGRPLLRADGSPVVGEVGVMICAAGASATAGETGAAGIVETSIRAVNKGMGALIARD